MGKKDNENELTNKIIDLCLFHNLEESKFYIKFLDNQVRFYQTHLEYLEDTKPYFFQKKKLEEHNKKIKECESKINEIYFKMNKEVQEIEKIHKMITS